MVESISSYFNDDDIKSEVIDSIFEQIKRTNLDYSENRTLAQSFQNDLLVQSGVLIRDDSGELVFNKESTFTSGYEDLESWKNDITLYSTHKELLQENLEQNYDYLVNKLSKFDTRSDNKFKEDNPEILFKEVISDALLANYSLGDIDSAYKNIVDEYGVADEYKLKQKTVQQTQDAITSSYDKMFSNGELPTAEDIFDNIEENIDPKSQSYELEFTTGAVAISFTESASREFISAFNNIIGGMENYERVSEKNGKLTNQTQIINGQKLNILNPIDQLAKPQDKAFVEYLVNNGSFPSGNFEVNEVSEDGIGTKNVAIYNFRLSTEEVAASKVLSKEEKEELLNRNLNLSVSFDARFNDISGKETYSQKEIEADLNVIKLNFDKEVVSMFSSEKSGVPRITNKEEDYESIARFNAHSKGAAKSKLKKYENFREYQQQIPIYYLKEYFAEEFNISSDDKKADVQLKLNQYQSQIPNITEIQEHQYQRAKENLKGFKSEREFEELFADAYLMKEALDAKVMEYADAVVKTERKGDEKRDARQMERDFRDFAAAKNKLESKYGIDFDRAYNRDFFTAMQNASRMEESKRTKDDEKDKEDISKVLKDLGVTLSPENQKESEIVELVEPSRKLERLKDKVRSEGAEAIAALNFNSNDKDKEVRQYRNAKERLDRNDENYLNQEVFPKNRAYDIAVKIETGELERGSEEVQNFVQANQNLYERTQTRIKYLEEQYKEVKGESDSKANVFEALMLREEIKLAETSLASALIIGSDRDKMHKGKDYLKTIEENESKLRGLDGAKIAQTLDKMLDEQVSIFIDGTLQDAPRYDGLAQIVKENDGVDSKSNDILDNKITTLADKHFGKYTESPRSDHKDGIAISGGTYGGERQGYGKYVGEYAELTVTKGANIALGDKTLLKASLENAGIGLQVNRNYDPKFPESQDLNFNSGLLGAFGNDSPDMAYVTFLDPSHYGSPFVNNSASASLAFQQNLNNGNSLNFEMGAETQGLFHTKSASAEYRIETGNQGRLTVGMLADHSALSGGVYTFTGPAIKVGYDKNITSTSDDISFGVEGAYSNQAYIQTPGPKRIENLDYLMGKANMNITLSDVTTNAYASLKVFNSPYKNYSGESSRFTNMWMTNVGGSIKKGDPIQGAVLNLYANTAYARIHNLEDRQNNRYTSFGTVNLGASIGNVEITDGLKGKFGTNYNLTNIYGVPNGTGGQNQRFQNLSLNAELKIKDAVSILENI